MSLHPAAWLAAAALVAVPGGPSPQPPVASPQPLKLLRPAHPTDAQRVMPGTY